MKQPQRDTFPAPQALAVALGLALAGAMPAQAITNATPTTAFQAVGFFGVQVAPDWVLTVNHVAAAFFPTNAGTIAFSNGLGVRGVIDRFDAPGAGPFPANDLSLLRLAPGSGGAPAFYLPINSDLFSNGVFPALDITITSAANSTLPRAYAQTTVTEFATQLDPDGDGPLGPVTVNYLLSLDAQRYVVSGDSGGGLFLGHVTDATSPLLGLASAQLGEVGQPPTGSAFVQLAAYRSWIDATLAGAAGNSQQLQWVSSVPEASSLLLWALGLAIVSGAAVLRRPAGR
jgi:hypothetical protein